MKHLLLKLSFLEIVFPLDVKCQPGTSGCVRPHPGPGCRLRTLHWHITLQHGEAVTIHSNPAGTMLITPDSDHFRVVIRILCHNDRPRRLSRRRSWSETQGQFLLLTAHWGGRLRAGLVLVAGEGWRTSQPEPEPGESGHWGRLWLRLGDTHTLTMDDEMRCAAREGGRQGPITTKTRSTLHSPAKTSNSSHYHSLVIDSWCGWEHFEL